MTESLYNTHHSHQVRKQSLVLAIGADLVGNRRSTCSHCLSLQRTLRKNNNVLCAETLSGHHLNQDGWLTGKHHVALIGGCHHGLADSLLTYLAAPELLRCCWRCQLKFWSLTDLSFGQLASPWSWPWTLWHSFMAHSFFPGIGHSEDSEFMCPLFLHSKKSKVNSA